jgi:mRNA-degrading endonuclease RelE of RelBE toxin-antitoxin system
MNRGRRFEIIFDELALEHMEAIDSKYDSEIREAIEERLTFEPDVPNRNRKLLLRATSIGATWEVRCGPDNRFRIFYDVDRREREVVVLAIARKEGNRLFIGKERFQL